VHPTGFRHCSIAEAVLVLVLVLVLAGVIIASRQGSAKA
jgi:hypothetical protein